MHAQALVVDCLVCDDNTTVYIACFFVSLCSTGFWTGGEILSLPILFTTGGKKGVAEMIYVVVNKN